MFPHVRLSEFSALSAWSNGQDIKFDWPQLAKNQSLLTYQGRTAIDLACRFLNLSNGDKVLIPAYNCGAEVDPLLIFGCRVQMYRVDMKSRIDFEDLYRKFDSGTKAVYVTHYFGWPQDLRELVDSCCKLGIPLIEDCALSLFSKNGSAPLGEVGDAAIFCLYKTLPIPDGGALRLSAGIPDAWGELKLPSRRVIRTRLSPFVGRWLHDEARSWLGPGYDWLRGLKRRLRPVRKAKLRNEEAGRPSLPDSYYFDQETAGWSISRVSRGFLNRTKPTEIVEKRRRNYLYLFQQVAELKGITPLFDTLPEGVCPLVLPLLVDDALSWERALNAWGVFPIRWWQGYHPNLPWDDFPEACSLKNRLLAFRIDQHLDLSALDEAAARLRDISILRR